MRPDSVPYVPVINGLLVERHKTHSKPVQASVGHRGLPSGHVALPTGSTPVPAQGSNRWSHRTSGVVEAVSRATTAPTPISAGTAKPVQALLNG